MKRLLCTILSLTAIWCVCTTANAAELLDVKPIVNGSSVSVEVTADIPMTYTYYKVPGQARAVVDIAEADPEKVEPLIVVNKGAVASISVDKAQIDKLVVSRLIFNLVSETDIQVSAADDRKKLTVTFGGVAAVAAKQAQITEAKPAVAAEPPTPAKAPAVDAAQLAVAVEVKPAAEVKPVIVAQPAKPAEDDPLGLDEPAAKTPAVAAAPVAAAAATAKAAQSQPSVVRVPKLEPVVPVTVAKTASGSLAVKEIVTGASYIEIRTNQSVNDYKSFKLTSPDRLVVDIPCDKTAQKAKTMALNKFGVAKARIGVSPKNIRIVLDSVKAGFPAYTITNTENGLRINFKQ